MYCSREGPTSRVLRSGRAVVTRAAALADCTWGIKGKLLLITMAPHLHWIGAKLEISNNRDTFDELLLLGVHG